MGSSSTIRQKRGSPERQALTDNSELLQDSEAKRKKFRCWVTDDDDRFLGSYEAGDTKAEKQRERVSSWPKFRVGQNPKEQRALLADHKQQSRQKKKTGKVKGISECGLEEDVEQTMDIQRVDTSLCGEVTNIVNMNQEEGRVSTIGRQNSTRHQEASTISRALKEWLDGVENDTTLKIIFQP